MGGDDEPCDDGGDTFPAYVPSKSSTSVSVDDAYGCTRRFRVVGIAGNASARLRLGARWLGTVTVQFVIVCCEADSSRAFIRRHILSSASFSSRTRPAWTVRFCSCAFSMSFSARRTAFR